MTAIQICALIVLIVFAGLLVWAGYFMGHSDGVSAGMKESDEIQRAESAKTASRNLHPRRDAGGCTDVDWRCRRPGQPPGTDGDGLRRRHGALGCGSPDHLGRPGRRTHLGRVGRETEGPVPASLRCRLGDPCHRRRLRRALNWMGGLIHMAPSNILALLPSLGLSKRVSGRISKTIKATPVLRERVAATRSRDARNTMDTKEFEGGSLYVTTAGSAANLSELARCHLQQRLRPSQRQRRGGA